MGSYECIGDQGNRQNEKQPEKNQKCSCCVYFSMHGRTKKKPGSWQDG